MNAETQAREERATRANELNWTYVGGYACPRRLRYSICLGGQCWCGAIRMGKTEVLRDHAAMWRDKSGRKFTLWEPRREVVTHTALAELVRAAEADNLNVELAPSIWDPPRTVGIRFEVAT